MSFVILNVVLKNQKEMRLKKRNNQSEVNINAFCHQPKTIRSLKMHIKHVYWRYIDTVPLLIYLDHPENVFVCVWLFLYVSYNVFIRVTSATTEQVRNELH